MKSGWTENYSLVFVIPPPLYQIIIRGRSSVISPPPVAESFRLSKFLSSFCKLCSPSLKTPQTESDKEFFFPTETEERNHGTVLPDWVSLVKQNIHLIKIMRQIVKRWHQCCSRNLFKKKKLLVTKKNWHLKKYKKTTAQCFLSGCRKEPIKTPSVFVSSRTCSCWPRRLLLHLLSRLHPEGRLGLCLLWKMKTDPLWCHLGFWNTHTHTQTCRV